MAALRVEAESSRRLTNHFTKPNAEMLSIGETGMLADLINWQIGREQKVFGFLNPAHFKKLHG